MSSNFTKSNTPYDQEIIDIADYVLNYEIKSPLAYETAWHCFIDTIGCGLEALEYEACTKLLGPVVEGLKIENGARVPGTSFQLDPVTAAFNIGAAIRWLDYNDTWLAAEWGHPSDNLGAILAVADWLNRNPKFATKSNFTMRDLFTAMIKAHEIQGCIALENSFNKVGIDHVVLVKVASTAVVAQMMGLSRDQILAALSLAWVDGQSLRTYRHFPNAGSRKSWAAGDATSRAVRLALIARAGEMGYPTALSAKTWGFYDSSFRGNKFVFQRPYSEYVMENILFKISYPAEFHAQTAVEAAMILNKKLASLGKRSDDIASVSIRTHEACIRIIDKKGELKNPADRDHTIQYMVAIPLIFGRLTARDYEDDVAADPRIDALRAKITCTEDKSFSADYHDPQKRSIANAITITLSDGTVLDEVVVEYPVGHKRRRDEGIPLLKQKYLTNLGRIFDPTQKAKIEELTLNYEKLSTTRVDAVMDLFVKKVRLELKINKVLLSLLTAIAINIGSIPIAHAEIPSVTVMSRNIYLGADVGRALELIPNLPAAAQYMWDQVKQTDFSKRAKILAREINQSSPDVIGLQEATIWYCKKYPWSKKVEVFNFTEQLLDNLNGRYELVSKDGVKALNPGFSINPMPFLTKVNDEQTFNKVFGRSSAACGFETGDALLVKKSDNLEVIEVGNSEYKDSYSIVPTIMTIYRGYSWADIKVNGVPTRFVTTHLESLWDENKVPNSAKQAMQLVSDLSNTKMPVIVMGDFNADPRDPRSKDQSNPGEQPVQSQACQANDITCNAYLIMGQAGYKDAGPDSLDPKNYTWGMNALLTGADSKRLIAAKSMGNYYGFTDRLDYIFSKNGTESVASEIIGTQSEYGSDHAGVVATIALLNQSNVISQTLPEHAPFPISFWQMVFVILILLITYLYWRKKKKSL